MKTFTPIKDSEGNIIDYSDGYHTFTELYEHRIALWIQLVKLLDEHHDSYSAWRAKKHYDGSEFEGWFILGVTCVDTGKQMTYHIPNREWDNCKPVRIFEKAREWDGHTSADVLKLLRSL